MNSIYEDEEQMRGALRAGTHRSVVGGMWEEIGELQSLFLRSNGLLPGHSFLDIGCGALRGGVKLVPYLQSGRYYGFDISTSLIEAGRNELALVGLTDHVPEENLRVTESFDVSGFPQFDFGIAQSVFTHIPLPRFTECLSSIRANFVGGRLFATFFIAPEIGQPPPPGGVTTFPDRDPFHTTVDAIIEASSHAGWTCRWIGQWAHPRGQQIGEFTPKH